MPKIIFYLTLSVFSALLLYFVKSVYDYSSDENWMREMVPEELRLKSLNYVLKMDEFSSAPVYVVGTSHVKTGFDGCNEQRLKKYYSSASNGAIHIEITKTLMSAARSNGLKNVDLILEVTLVREISAPKRTGIIYQHLFEGVPEILKLFIKSSRERETDCNLSFENRIGDNKLLDESQQEGEQIELNRIEELSSLYTQHIDDLVNVCENTIVGKITLVSLPIHPDLYSVPHVKDAFSLVEKRLQEHLHKIKHDCNISYLNLVALGNEFPESKYWFDYGHFTPEVGERVLSEIESSQNMK